MNRKQETQEEHLKLVIEKIKFLWELKLIRCTVCIKEMGESIVTIDDVYLLSSEYARLRNEYSQLASFISNNIGSLERLNPSWSAPQNQLESIGVSRPMARPSNPSANAKKPLITGLAEVSMDELVILARSDEPFWKSTSGGKRILNQLEYIRHFGPPIGVEQYGFKLEASKDICYVDRNPIDLVKTFIIPNQWIDTFSTICRNISLVEVLCSGNKRDHDGALLVMTADFQVPTPFVPRRSNYFARYCRNLGPGTWVVVDVSIDCMHSLNNGARYRRRPSGCLIQAQANGGSRVVWVELVEVDDSGVHDLYKELVDSSLAFGAKRWTATLQLHCLHLARFLTSNTNERSVRDAENDLMRLAHRMVANFCAEASATTPMDPRTEEFEADTTSKAHLVLRRNVVDPGIPYGVIINEAISMVLPFPPKTLFDFLNNENHRPKWDVLSKNGEVSIVKQFAYGNNNNSTTLLELKNELSTIPINIFLLQESCHDDTRSLVVYIPMDSSTLNNLIHGVNPDHIRILPSGFAIHPMTGHGSENEPPASLLTISFQFFADSSPAAEVSNDYVEDAKTIIISTAKRVKAALFGL